MKIIVSRELISSLVANLIHLYSMPRQLMPKRSNNRKIDPKIDTLKIEIISEKDETKFDNTKVIIT